MTLPEVGQPTNEELLGHYRQCVEDARKWREGQGYDQDWAEYIKLYAGDHYPKDCDDMDEVMVNMTWSTINIIQSSTLVRSPEIGIEPINPNSVLAAAKVKEVLRHDWDAYDFNRPIRRAYKDSLVIGHGWLKTWYKVHRIDATPYLLGGEGDHDEYDLTKLRRDISQMNAQGVGEGFHFTAPQSDEELTARLSQGQVTIDDRPYIERVSPFDMFMDPSVTEYDKVRWIAQRSLVPLRTARQNTKWDKSAREALSGRVSSSQASLDETRRQGDSALRHADLTYVWEFYDLVEGTWCQFGENGSEFLRSPRPMPLPYGQPFTFVSNQSVPDQLYPIGEVKQIASLQREMNRIRRSQLEDLDRFRVMFLGETDFLNTGKNREKIESNEPGVVLEYDAQTHGAQPLRAIDPPSIDPDLYGMSAVIPNDIYQVSAVTEYQRGLSGSATATEASIVNDASQARVAEKLGMVEHLMRDVAKRIVMLYQVLLVNDRVIRITGDLASLNGQARAQIEDSPGTGVGGGDLYMAVSRSDIQGQFDFRVEAGSTQPSNPTLKRQVAQQMIAITAPFMGTVVDPTEVLTYALKEGFGIPFPERFFMGQPPVPVEQAGVGTAPGGATPLGGQTGTEQSRSAPIPTQ